MKKEGAIVLGSGGDCCLNNTTSAKALLRRGHRHGLPGGPTEDAIQANIVKTATASKSAAPRARCVTRRKPLVAESLHAIVLRRGLARLRW